MEQLTKMERLLFVGLLEEKIEQLEKTLPAYEQLVMIGIHPKYYQQRNEKIETYKSIAAKYK